MEILEELFKDISDGICVSDAQGKLLYANPAAAQMLDIDPSDGKDRRLCDLLCGHLCAPGSPDCASHCPLLNSNPSRQAVTFQGLHGPRTSYEWRDWQLQRLERWQNLRVRCLKMPTPLLDSWGKEKRFTLIEDVSAEAELQRRKEDWRHMIIHDLRTPLSSVYGALMTLDEIPPDRALDPEERKLLQVSLRSCRRMTELLELYLEIAQLDSGKMSIRPESVALFSLVQKCVEDQSPLAHLRRIDVSVAIPPGLSARADPALLYRVTQNLLNNAIKFTPEGGRVTVAGIGDREERIGLSVKDTGHGIAPDAIPFIFDRFYQANARREGRIHGNGLGLTFCREALKAMGGGIEVLSKPGDGSEFVVWLPRPAPEPPAIAGEAT